MQVQNRWILPVKTIQFENEEEVGWEVDPESATRLRVALEHHSSLTPIKCFIAKF